MLITPATTAPVSLDQLISPYICMCLYGGPGIGKTVFSLGSQWMRTFVLDIDGGTDSAASLKTSERLVGAGYPPIQRQLIQAWPVNTYQDFLNGVNYFYQYRNHYDLLVVDTATELARLIHDENKARNKHIYADQRDWGLTLDTLETLGRTFRKLGKHSIFSCHEHESYDSTTMTNKYRANFKGQFSEDYRKHFSLIMRYVIADQQVQGADQKVYTQTLRYLECNRTPYNDCKDRSSSLEMYEAPVLDNIVYKYVSAINAINANQGGQQA